MSEPGLALLGPNHLVIKTTRYAYATLAVQIDVQTGARNGWTNKIQLMNNTFACVYTAVFILDTLCRLTRPKRSFAPVADHESWLNSPQSHLL